MYRWSCRLLYHFVWYARRFTNIYKKLSNNAKFNVDTSNYICTRRARLPFCFHITLSWNVYLVYNFKKTTRVNYMHFKSVSMSWKVALSKTNSAIWKLEISVHLNNNSVIIDPFFANLNTYCVMKHEQTNT